MLAGMSLETQVQNLASETTRRWKTLRTRDPKTRAAARDILAKLAFGAWLLAGNLLRTTIGRRVPSQRLTIRHLQQRLQEHDDDHLLAQLNHAVDAVLWHLVLARRDGIHLRRVESLVADFVDASEADLAKLSRVEKA